jgi:endonuclease/exonuclease/phosphatase family metal-dependent hydrolase
MILKTIQWNIGGGKRRNEGDDPVDPLVYCREAMDEIITVLRKYAADIITIQECHSGAGEIQAETMAKSLGSEYFANDVYDESHIEEDQGLCQAIISRFPIERHEFKLFLNPKFETSGPKGEQWLSHDKGVTSCFIGLAPGKNINVKTSHSFPYRRFHLDPLDEVTLPLRNDMARKLRSETELFLYQGDINYNEYSIDVLLPDYLKDGMREVVLDTPTTPKGRKYDHIMFKGIKHLSSEVISDVLTDHFPIYSEFEIN